MQDKCASLMLLRMQCFALAHRKIVFVCMQIDGGFSIVGIESPGPTQSRKLATKKGTMFYIGGNIFLTYSVEPIPK